MNRPLAWVLGAGGLLGRYVLAAMDSDPSGPVPWRRGPSGIPWEDAALARTTLGELAAAFFAEVQRRDCEWMVLWCAGAGIVGTGNEALARETRYLAHLLEFLGQGLPKASGRILLASSAGGVFGVGSGQPLTEHSACHPVSEYGRNKLVQESLVRTWASGRPTVSSLVARISNLYGPGQRLDKPQGLIAHISRSILDRTPIRIFVPLDTLRDYLYVEDGAEMLLAALRRLGANHREDVVKIFHSGQVATIAGVMGIFTRLARGRARMICASSPTAALQPLSLHFRSEVWADLRPLRPVGLPEGIQRVHGHLLNAFQAGELPGRI